MNRQITRLAVAGVTLIAALIVATTYWQTWAAAGLNDRQDNAVQRVAEFSIKRGRILAASGRVLAENRTRRVSGRRLYFRRYPERGLTAHVVGYSTQMRSRAGIERSLNDYLTGANTNLTTVLDTQLDRLRGTTIEGNDVVLTLRPDAQRAALQALGNRCGAVAAVEPRTGRVLVLASSPTYDPNLVEGRFNRIKRIRAQCREPNALFNRATHGLYAPGSTFKVVTSSAALDSGRYSLASTFHDPGYCVEYNRRVSNYDTSSPFGTVNFVQAMQYSINSVFCNIGKELGGRRILEHARRFGFYSKVPLETPMDERVASGLYEEGKLYVPEKDFDVDPGRLAFGQERLLVTPLQMAMVAAAVANEGKVMRPYVVERVVGPRGKVVAKTDPDVLGRAIEAQNADALTTQMRAVVEGGTGGNAAIPGVSVAGKTGTAETGRAGLNTVAFIGFAPVDRPRVAIAVFVEEQRSTGGQTAAPIARSVMQALVGSR